MGLYPKPIWGPRGVLEGSSGHENINYFFITFGFEQKVVLKVQCWICVSHWMSPLAQLHSLYKNTGSSLGLSWLHDGCCAAGKNVFYNVAVQFMKKRISLFQDRLWVSAPNAYMGVRFPLYLCQ